MGNTSITLEKVLETLRNCSGVIGVKVLSEKEKGENI